MSATSLVVELVLGGALVELALILLLEAVAPGQLRTLLRVQQDLLPAVGVVATILAYYLGSLLNLGAGGLFRITKIETQAARSAGFPATSDVVERREQRLRVYRASADWRAHLDYIYAQVRVFRAASLGFLMLGFAIGLAGEPLSGMGRTLTLLCFVASICSGYGTFSSLKAYYGIIVSACRLLDRDPPSGGLEGAPAPQTSGRQLR